MAVQFDHQQITIFGDSVEYDPYYFAIASEVDGTDYRGMVKQVLRQWAEALAQMEAGNETLYLPFGIYDQCLECFAATGHGERITLRCIWLTVEGHSLDLRNLHEFISSSVPHSLVGRSRDFGEYSKADLIRALSEANPSAA